VRQPKTKEQLAEEYRAHRENMAQRMRDKYAAASDIGDIPKPADPVRRAEAESSLRAFCDLPPVSVSHGLE